MISYAINPYFSICCFITYLIHSYLFGFYQSSLNRLSCMQLRLLVYKWDNLERVVEEPRKSIGRRQQLPWHFFRCLKNGCTKNLFSNILVLSRNKNTLFYLHVLLPVAMLKIYETPEAKANIMTEKVARNKRTSFIMMLMLRMMGPKCFVAMPTCIINLIIIYKRMESKIAYKIIHLVNVIISFNTNLDCL